MWSCSLSSGQERRDCVAAARTSLRRKQLSLWEVCVMNQEAAIGPTQYTGIQSLPHFLFIPCSAWNADATSGTRRWQLPFGWWQAGVCLISVDLPCMAEPPHWALDREQIKSVKFELGLFLFPNPNEQELARLKNSRSLVPHWRIHLHYLSTERQWHLVKPKTYGSRNTGFISRWQNPRRVHYSHHVFGAGIVAPRTFNSCCPYLPPLSLAMALASKL